MEMIRPVTRFLKTAVLVCAFAPFWACGDDSAKGLGSACTVETVCDGVCLVDLPGGMCAQPCSAERTCPSGTCVKVAGGFYCVPECAQDAQCRTDEGYLCVMGGCRPPVSEGGHCGAHDDCEGDLVCVGQYCGVTCQDSTDCEPGYYCLEQDGSKGCAPDDCSDGVCNRPCTAHSDCAAGTYCNIDGFCAVDECDEDGVCDHPCTLHEDCPQGTYCAWVEGANHCVFLPADMGPGELGASCADADCDSGYVCLGRGEEDASAYCSKQCTSDLDCGPEMVCRGTLDGDGNPIDYCFNRGFCEPCQFDGQCGFATEKCVAANPAVGGSTYCSTICDPSQSDTCPVDTTCMEAFFCEDDNVWVADCAWCDGACNPGDPQIYQCFHDFGACIGDGTLCTPCNHSGQCDSGGACLTATDNGNQYCSAPCDGNGRCPDGFWCVEVTGLGDQCVPRRSSCSEPSGGQESCDLCETLFDCVSGSCLEFGWGQVCFEECTPGLDECPAYTACEQVDDIHGLSWNLCMPQAPIDDCTKLEECQEHCPTGPASCDGNQPTYCD